jgi:hypothetical protein
METVDWTVLPLADFDTAQPRDTGGLGGELMAQIRNTGRIRDNFRFVLGGSSMITPEISSKDTGPIRSR